MSPIASSRYLCCPGVSDLEQILLLLLPHQYSPPEMHNPGYSETGLRGLRIDHSGLS